MCGAVLKAQEEIPKLDKKEDKEEEPEKEPDPCEVNGHNWTEATCTEPKTCSVCGAIGERPSQAVFKCTDPNCKIHTLYEHCGKTMSKHFADFNAARNIAMSTDFVEEGKASKKKSEKKSEPKMKSMSKAKSKTKKIA